MPTYEYICDACGKEYEKFQSIMSKPDRVCPSCKARKVRRKIGIGSAVIFKGSGFYETDYRSEGYTKAAEADRKSSQEASGASAGTGDSKTTAAGPTTSDAKSGATSGAVGASNDGKSTGSTSNSSGELNSSTKRGATSSNVSGGGSSANSNATTTAKSTSSGEKSSSASSESSSSNAPRSAASTKQHMVSKAVHPSRVGRGQGNLRRKKK